MELYKTSLYKMPNTASKIPMVIPKKSKTTKKNFSTKSESSVGKCHNIIHYKMTNIPT